jgi:hypothetical protein
MATAKRKKNPNADLIEAIRTHKDQILKFREHAGNERSVVLFDYQRRKIRVSALNRYKSMLRKGSYSKLDEEYKRAGARNKVLVLVWDSATRRLVTTTLRHG